MLALLRKLFYHILWHIVICSPRINLYFTDWENDSEDYVVSQHDCLHVRSSSKQNRYSYQVLSYCLTERVTESDIQEVDYDRKFTFAELYKNNITSQQLYIWSAPIDTIERYQFYVDQWSASNQSSIMSLQLFYNCTLPRFGTKCQYSLDNYKHHYSSLHGIIEDFYNETYKPTSLTCYTHLKCNRGSTLACLDWTEICNGYVDCLNDQIDEENCWQLEINECGEDEYRCSNGQCIPKIFLNDDPSNFECLDRSDEINDRNNLHQVIHGEPTFSNEDISCLQRHFLLNVKLTSSCVSARDRLLSDVLLLDTPSSLTEQCWLTFACHHSLLKRNHEKCSKMCSRAVCNKIINEICPDLIVLPAGALAFGHIFAIYLKQDIVKTNFIRSPNYLCYNDQLCSGFYSNATLFNFNGSTCRLLKDFPISFSIPIKLSWYDRYVGDLYEKLYQCNTIVYKNISICNSPAMYQCINSIKCISVYRLCDGRNDCDFNDDEQCAIINDTCAVTSSEILIKCTISNICISPKRVHDAICDCGLDEHGLCQDEVRELDRIRKHIYFPIICNGFIDLIPVMIDGRNETDETECEYWSCNNVYTRCDGIWHCSNGADEVDCDTSPLLLCPLNHHICISPKTKQLMCLPIEKANDGIIDCVGAMDERRLCQSDSHDLKNVIFYCMNTINQPCISLLEICNKRNDCIDGDDETFCSKTKNTSTQLNICTEKNRCYYSPAEKFLRKYMNDTNIWAARQFLLDTTEIPSADAKVQKEILILRDTSTTHVYDQRCHRGLPLTIWSNNNENSTIPSCLCPPSFYGNQCQYQNQRVSLTMRFQTFSNSRRTLFAIVVLLIDDSDERLIHSYQQLTYVYSQQCQMKYNVYLLYSNRPKIMTKNYSIHIDIYEKITHTYRGSILIPINYTFLPVHRIAVQLYLPKSDHIKEFCSDGNCSHGQCIKYLNDPTSAGFCRCDPGWSGKYCTKPYNCTCSPDSLCTGVSVNNRSICICPINKWGPRCLLSTTQCQLNGNMTCQNGAQCIPLDESAGSDKSFLCICPKGFSGELCEIVDNKIILFHKDIIMSQSIMVHFIRVINNAPPENGSTFKTVSINQKSVSIQWSNPFHIAFVELFHNDYYLITVQKTYNRSSIITKTIEPRDRCKHLRELLNESIANFHPLRRIKYYHLACQQHSPLLSCFYDDNYFCFCYNFHQQRLANCFEFNSSIKHDCFGHSNCENGAKCLQDKPTCPQTSICVCPKCFHGARCQFSSAFSGLSLDSILGYHIQPDVSINYQPLILKISVLLTTVLVAIGFINGLLALVTFQNEETRRVGCGFYLLGSSITTLLIVILFTLKFWILIGAQITYVTNRVFLTWQCYSIDFLLRVCLIMDQWLNACVAMERAFAIIKGTHFDRKKTIKMAKYIIFGLVVLTIGTTIHDPIHRRLLYDDNDDEKRIWCIVSYSTSLQTYNAVINVMHFLAPFLINIISAITIIVMSARQQTNLQTNQTYRELLRQQFSAYSFLLISPIILVILGLPRLIISFVSSCMNSYGSSWLFLMGYFISYFPPMITFLVFVMPSKLYKREFEKSMARYRQVIKKTFRSA